MRDASESRSFSITPEERARIDTWLREDVFPTIMFKQLENKNLSDADRARIMENGHPYEGAIGGGLTYQFTTTTLGTVFKVTYAGVDADYTLDLTDYESW